MKYDGSLQLFKSNEKNSKKLTQKFHSSLPTLIYPDDSGPDLSTETIG